MEKIRRRPGPAAAQAFRLGMWIGGVVWAAGLGLLYWVGALTPVAAGYSLVMLFPVYLVLVAAVLSRWLDYQQDVTSLRPVSRNRSSK